MHVAAAMATAWQPGGPPECTSLHAPSHLRADDKPSPALGTAPQPRLSWVLPALQTVVSSLRVQFYDGVSGVLVWDSGLVILTAAGPWELPYEGPPLSAGRPYVWRVQTQDASGDLSEWSSNATLVPGLWSGDWLPDVEPLWAHNATAQLVLLRASVDTIPQTTTVVAAYAFATANPQRSLPDDENGKLLGAYKLYIGGQLVGLGPGRPGRCGPVCPVSHSPGTCTCQPEQVYDVLDVTAAVQDGLVLGQGHLAVALQCFQAPGPLTARVQIQVNIFLADGTVVTVGTTTASPTWLALDATLWMAPSCCTERAWFYGPTENWDARLEPVGWRTARLTDLSPVRGWQPAAAAGAFFAPLVPKPTLSLAVHSGMQPVVTKLVAPGHLFLDFGKELQGGLTISLPASTPAGIVLTVQQGEELVSTDPPAVMYQMRTGNDYSGKWTTRAGAQTIEMHEYLEFRYAQVLWGSAWQSLCEASALGDYSTPVTIGCPDNAVVETFLFASWGHPSGACEGSGSNNSFAVNSSCHYSGTLSVLQGLCVNRNSCTFVPSDQLFGGIDPCHLTPKRLAAAWTCATPSAVDVMPNVTAWQVYYPARFAGDSADQCPGGAAATGDPGGSLVGLGQFSSSSASLNDIFSFCEYTVRCTTLDVVTDSNTRQRSPVCAEAVLATNLQQAAASFESASQAFTTDYILNGSPGGAGWAEWQSLLISSVWALWQATGSLAQYRLHAPLLRRYLELELVGPNSLWTCNAGDSWQCNQPEVDWPTSMRDGFVFRPTNTVVNAHLVGALYQYADLADADGDAASATLARATAVNISTAMVKHLFNVSTGAFMDGLETTHAAIHSSAYSLARGVVDAEPAAGAALWQQLLARLDPVSGIPVGPYPGMFYGEALFRNTTDHGRVAVQNFLLNNGTNSWLNQLRQGATTTMEAWTPREKPNLTWSHPWMAFPLELIARWLLGVRPVTPGYATLLVQPQPGPLEWVYGTVPTPKGPVTLSLAQNLDSVSMLAKSFHLNVSVPGATLARVCLPLSACPKLLVELDGASAVGTQHGDYACLDAIPAGPHRLVCPTPT